VVSTFRKNSLFVGGLEAGERYVNLLTVLLNCELAGVNPTSTSWTSSTRSPPTGPSTASPRSSPSWLAARQTEDQCPRRAAVVAVT
jgi:hypothetical protein